MLHERAAVVNTAGGYGLVGGRQRGSEIKILIRQDQGASGDKSGNHGHIKGHRSSGSTSLLRNRDVEGEI